MHAYSVLYTCATCIHIYINVIIFILIRDTNTLNMCRCAMALLHSRINRVIYHHPNPFCGALRSKYKLHVQQGFNHHFEVYQGTNTSVAAESED